MSPYRTRTAVWTPSPNRKKKPLWPWIGPVLVGLSAVGLNLAEIDPRLLIAPAVSVVLGIVIIIAGHAKTSAIGRLCRLTWHGGDRFGATMLFIGVAVPKYSAKRIERNRAGVARFVERRRREWNLFG